MRVEFRQGVPEGCAKWLWENVGPGNLSTGQYLSTGETDLWFYERIEKLIWAGEFKDTTVEYIPTITVNDEKLAMFFILRWQ